MVASLCRQSSTGIWSFHSDMLKFSQEMKVAYISMKNPQNTLPSFFSPLLISEIQAYFEMEVAPLNTEQYPIIFLSFQWVNLSLLGQNPQLPGSGL